MIPKGTISYTSVSYTKMRGEHYHAKKRYRRFVTELALPEIAFNSPWQRVRMSCSCFR